MKKLLGFILILGLGFGIGWFWNNYENRPCVTLENKIRLNYKQEQERRLISNELMDKVSQARMYAELADSGCPENSRAYRDQSEQIMGELAQRGFVSINSEIKVDMDKVSAAVEEAVKPAIEAMGQFFDKVKNTKVNITVE